MTTRKPAQDGGNVTNDLNSINLNTVNHSGAVSLEEDQRLFQPEQKRINDDYTNESVIKGEAKKIQNPPAVQLNMPKASENYVEVAPPINPDAAFSVHRNVNLVEEYEDYLRLEEYREQIMKNYHEKNSAEEDSSAGATESSKNVKNVAKRKNNVRFFLSKTTFACPVK
uniref:Uncharacterized protein n=1 Tax=Panagrolaimus davidi TaxID=227884 RepID=A0A914PBX8_9BILA